MKRHAPYLLSFLVGAAIVTGLLALIPMAGAAPSGEPAAAAVVAAEPAAQPGPRPSDQLHDPLTDLGGAIDDAEAARRQGWPLLALVGLILVSRGLAKARKRWPGSHVLAWMGGRAGLVVISAGVIGGAAFDALALGGSWFAAGVAALGAALTLIEPEPLPAGEDIERLQDTLIGYERTLARTIAERDAAPAPPRTPESGHIALPLLGCVAVVFLAGLAYACAPARPAARAATGSIIDCTLVSLGSNADAYRARIELAIRDNTVNGAVAWSKVVAVVVDLVPEAGVDVAGCVARETFERILGARGVTASADLRAGWDRVRDEALGGRRYLWAVP